MDSYRMLKLESTIRISLDPVKVFSRTRQRAKCDTRTNKCTRE